MLPKLKAYLATNYPTLYNFLKTLASIPFRLIPRMDATFPKPWNFLHAVCPRLFTLVTTVFFVPLVLTADHFSKPLALALARYIFQSLWFSWIIAKLNAIFGLNLNPTFSTVLYWCSSFCRFGFFGVVAVGHHSFYLPTP
jgi:hypothetical protein